VTLELSHPQYKVSTEFASQHIPILRGDTAEVTVFWVNRPLTVTVIEFDFSDPDKPLIGTIEEGVHEVMWFEPNELTFRGRSGV
jgi:hypothetical protein